MSQLIMNIKCNGQIFAVIKYSMIFDTGVIKQDIDLICYAL
jgi:hypothetical protein